MMIDATETRQRIVERATELFAAKGVQGTSVRDIAKAAQVNLAAVNYHFGSKEKLYLEIVQSGIQNFIQGIKELAKHHSTVEGLAVALYNHLTANGAQLVNNFRLILGDYEAPMPLMDTNRLPGPPGLEYLLEKLEVELPQASTEKKHWACKVIFVYTFHIAVISSSKFGQGHCPEVFKPQQIDNEIRLLVQTLLKSIKN